MGFYREQILPRLTDLALRGKEAAQLRARAAGLGEVVEVGLGSGLTMPYYPSAVTRRRAIVVARVIAPREAQAYGLAFSEALADVHAAGLPMAPYSQPASSLRITGRAERIRCADPGLGQPFTLDVFTPPEHVGAAVEGRIAATCAMSGPGRGGGYDN